MRHAWHDRKPQYRVYVLCVLTLSGEPHFFAHSFSCVVSVWVVCAHSRAWWHGRSKAVTLKPYNSRCVQVTLYSSFILTSLPRKCISEREIAHFRQGFHFLFFVRLQYETTIQKFTQQIFTKYFSASSRCIRNDFATKPQI